ncbi:hypothetical protein BU15DRAFT_63245 [Melanogaster broomeanus]|nr:hypothetical protein BU15DRAFT_63245 [Melanogaster broomeanus]
MCIGYVTTYLSHAYDLRNTRSDPLSPPTRHVDVDNSKRDPRKSVKHARTRKHARRHVELIPGPVVLISYIGYGPEIPGSVPDTHQSNAADPISEICKMRHHLLNRAITQA